ncbi:MAG TPA: hypothetical protein PLZ58_00445 [Candidatus Saccharibacteria bacterium]|nr:hypothetical protein [Candidatus Saccharibacteria bacterium]HRQ07211.1 hypothetical protein [Candidatus Saccharibacteria bacterium]
MDTILSLFEVADIHQSLADEARGLVAESGIIRSDDFDFDDEDYPLITAKQTVKEIRDKLKVLGYGKMGIKGIFDHHLSAMLDSNRGAVERYSGSSDGLESYVPEAQAKIDYLGSISFDEWFDIVSGQTTASRKVLVMANELLHHYDDPLFVLSIILANEEGAKELTFDFTDLHEYSDDITFAIDAYNTNIGKPIIITEGTTDVEFLKKSIEVLYPYLARYVRFLETDFKPETNADAILKMAKNFASAGISENMLFILDNDTAGTSAIASFGQSARRRLPNNFCITQYPSTELLNSYPTKGPQGDSDLDVNGRAGSVELYLGRDALSDSNGFLRPIQWKGYIEKVETYQGEVLDKRAIQNSFREKYRGVLAGDSVNPANWIEMKVLLEHIFDKLSELPSIYPLQSVDDY